MKALKSLSSKKAMQPAFDEWQRFGRGPVVWSLAKHAIHQAAHVRLGCIEDVRGAGNRAQRR